MSFLVQSFKETGKNSIQAVSETISHSVNSGG